MSANAIFEAFTIGDQRPIVVDVTPSDDATVASATYQVFRRGDPTGTVYASGNAVVTARNGAFRLSTPSLVSFPTVDIYTCNFGITWSDGQVDNTVNALIPVNPLRH
jgi:hypothetical protein